MKRQVSSILIILASLVRAATFTVDNTSDSGTGSLRQAVLDAAAAPGTDTIVFSPAPFPAITRIGNLGTSSGIDDNTLENFTVPAGNKRALVVAACHAADTNITSVTFGGLPLSQVVERTDGYVVASLWTRAMDSSPTPVSGDIVVTRAGTESLTQTIFAASYANVDQVIPMDSPTSDPSLVSAVSAVTVSSRPGDLVFNLIDGFRWFPSPATFIAGEGQTRLHNSHGPGFAGGVESYATSVKPGNGDERMEWAGDFNVYFHVAANIRASAAINLSSEIVLDDTAGVVIDGSAVTGGVTLSGERLGRIFRVSPSSSLTLRKLSLTRGNGPASETEGTGGAVCNQSGTIVMEDCTLVTCQASSGGAISNLAGTMTLSRCFASGNSATSNGGGIDNDHGNCSLSHSTISGNRATQRGSAIHSEAATAAMEIRHCTISGNTNGSALSDGIWVTGQTTTLASSIVFGNGSGDLFNDGGQLQRQGANIVGSFANEGSPTCGTDSGPPAIAANPLLAVPAHYGGPTLTMALLPSSPARDASVGSAAVSDQRGFPIHGSPDLGAYESGNLVQNYESWALETLPGFLTHLQRAANFDLDGDGSANSLEWTAGTDIHDVHSNFHVVSVTTGAGTIHLTCSTVAGRNYHLESSSDLTSWTFVPGSVRNGDGLDLTYDLTGPSFPPGTFFRVGVSP